MASATLKPDNDDVLTLADEILARLSQPLFEAMGPAMARVQSAAQHLNAEADRDLAVLNLRHALKELEGELRPIGQSVAIRIMALTHRLLSEREAQIKAKDPLVINAVEMHLASLIMSVKRRMIAGRLPMPTTLLTNLAALRVQLPTLQAANRAGTKDGARDDELPEAPKPMPIQSWSERLARRFMGR
jgi:hypothetical protein